MPVADNRIDTIDYARPERRSAGRSAGRGGTPGPLNRHLDFYERRASNTELTGTKARKKVDTSEVN